MSLDRSFQVVSRILALVGLLSLIQTGEIGLFFWLLGLSAVLASLVLAYRDSFYSPARRIWTLLNILVLTYFLFDFLLFSQSLLVASTHFIIFLMVNKLFNLRSPQDHMQLYLISLLQLLAASTFTINFSFLVIFVLYLLVATWALLLHHLVTENRDFTAEVVPGVNRTGSPPGISWTFFFNTNIVALVALCCTVIIFVSLPRISMGFFHEARKNLIRLPGFSTVVNLGAIGEVKSDSAVVMRVKPSRFLEPTEGIYWRGMTFDDYDGTSWMNSFRKSDVATRSESGVFELNKVRRSGRMLSQEIILEPVEADVIFGAPEPVEIKGRLSGVKINEAGSLSFMSVPATRVNYAVVSRIPVLSYQDAEREKITLPPDLEKIYLQLPDDMDRVRGLAREVTASGQSVFQKAVAVERFLKENFRYTLNVRPSLFEDPINDFLFVQKAGFCEHYATAMVLMLRSTGIPARLATGFLPGEWNDIGEHFTVRQNDAHAWVEVYFPGAGWYPFDPTPGGVDGNDLPLLSFVSRVIDSLQWKWNRYVVSFSFRDQMNLASELKGEVLSLRSWAVDRGTFYVGWLRSSLKKVFSHPLGIILTLCAAGGLVLYLSRRLQWRLGLPAFLLRMWRGRSRRKSAVRFYGRMLELFRKRGLFKPDHLTPREFIERVRMPESESRPPFRPSWFEPASEITQLYYRVRFAGIPLNRAEERRVDSLLMELKQSLPLP